MNTVAILAGPNDRITRAWEIRHGIHAFLREIKGATMVEIFEAFPGIHRETLRKAVTRMRSDGTIAMTGRRGQEGFYRSVLSEIKPQEATRKQLALGAELCRHIMRCKKSGLPVEGNTDTEALEDIKRLQAKRDAAKQPGKIVHHCGDTPQASGSRGQGALRRTVYINCHQSY